jgi:hypothetical protein
MPFRPRLFAIAAGCIVLGMFGLAYANHTLNHDQPDRVVFAGFLSLFMLLACSLVPLILHGFVTAQARIGNAEVPMVKAMRERQRSISIGLWIVFAIGALMGMPLLMDAMFEQVSSVPTAQ